MDSRRRHEGGQILVIFILFLTAMLAATGLVVDVGRAWGQERTQQNVADAAALAGATAEANGATRAGIIAAAVANADSNGYRTNAATQTVVAVNIPPTSGAYAPGGSQSGPLSTNDCSTPALYPCWIEVVVSRPHANYFAGVVGQSSWNVTARGVAVGGIFNAANNGLAPLMFGFRSLLPENSPGTEKEFCDPQNVLCSPKTTFPIAPAQFNWTTFCVDHPNNCNVDAATAKGIINGGDFQATVYLGMYLGPHNNGNMAAVCQALKDQNPNPAGTNLPVAISDDNGDMVGFWMWHFVPAHTDCTGDVRISGYFTNDITLTLPLTISTKGTPAQYGESGVRLVE